MSLNAIHFAAPPAVPTAQELAALSARFALESKAHRASLMNAVAALVGVPAGGWHGQAKLFEKGDVRIVWLLRRLANVETSSRAAANLKRAARYADAEIMLTLVTAARENSSSVSESR